VPRSIPRIVIVGVCGSGKTVLADALTRRGYNARAMAQEHSFVPGMWRAHGQPNVLIYLDATADTVNRRLGRQDWTPAVLAEQRRRLADAHAYCDLYLATDDLDEAAVLTRVVAFLAAGWPDVDTTSAPVEPSAGSSRDFWRQRCRGKRGKQAGRGA